LIINAALEDIRMSEQCLLRNEHCGGALLNLAAQAIYVGYNVAGYLARLEQF
jgi:hypothetical protein